MFYWMYDYSATAMAALFVAVFVAATCIAILVSHRFFSPGFTARSAPTTWWLSRSPVFPCSTERRLLIVGDAVVGNPPGRLSLLRERALDDPAKLRVSVRQLLSLDFDTLLVGDGECVLNGAQERLRELVGTFPG
jgi:Metallo-beta-lactamase superfamily